MIQRKQTLYLLIAAIFCISYWFGNPVFAEIDGVLKGTDNQAVAQLKFSKTELENIDVKSDLQIFEHSFIPYTLIIIAVLSLVAIFIFKKRPLQLRFASYLIMFDLLLFFLLYYQTSLVSKVFESSETHWKVYAFMPLLLPILHFLALRGIIHDIKLLKSINRLR